MTFTVDGEKLHEEEYGWADRESAAIRIRCRLGRRASSSSRSSSSRWWPRTSESTRWIIESARCRSRPARRGAPHREAKIPPVLPEGPAPEDPREARCLRPRSASPRSPGGPTAGRWTSKTLTRLVAMAKETYRRAGRRRSRPALAGRWWPCWPRRGFCSAWRTRRRDRRR